MSRSARGAVGGVVVLVLLLVAAVSGLVALVGAGQLRDDAWFAYTAAPEGDFFSDPVTSQAEVLDVDGVPADGWLSVDVAFETEAGEREVTSVDLGPQDGSQVPPQVGDVIEVVHERSDPSWALRADDPVLVGEPTDDVSQGGDADARAAAQALVDRTRVLAVGSLALGLLAVVLTVVAVRRAPTARGWADAPAPQQSEASPAPPR